jgi:hypothetical protein
MRGGFKGMSPEAMRSIGIGPPKRRVLPKPLMLAWTGGYWGMRPTLLGVVPEGTIKEEIEYSINGIDYSDQVTVGRLEDFVSACMNPGTDD